jgi:hypothetical protein
VEYLMGVPDEGGLVDAIPEKTRKLLETGLAHLPDAARAEVLASRPLAHVVSGGDSDEALLALATSDAAASELLAATPGAPPAELRALVASVRAIARRAAARWLKRQARTVASANKFDISALQLIDRVAETSGRADIQFLTRRLISQIHASSESFLAFAYTAARIGELEAARSALQQARARPGAARAFGAFGEAERLIETVERSRAGPAGLSPEQRVSLSRELIRFGVTARALHLLKDDATAAPSNLALATTLSLAQLDAEVCPGLPSAVQHAVLCEAAWSSEPAVKTALELIAKAWRSRGGRDSQAVVDYLGLVEVIPWQYAQVRLADDRAAVTRDFRVRLASLERIVEQARPGLPGFEAISLFVQVMRAGFETLRGAQAEPTLLPPGKQHELWARAEALAGPAKEDVWARRAILAVASLLCSEREVEPLLQLLPSSLEPADGRTRGTIRRWVAVATRRADLASRAEAELSDLLLRRAVDTFERAEIVLFMAESGAAFSGTEKSYETLAKIGTQLATKGGPTELRLRALLDAVGGLGRTRRAQEARRLLDASLPELEASAAASSDLYQLAEAYSLLLDATLAPAEERPAAEQRFEAFFQTRRAAALPNLIRVWAELWRAEFTGMARQRRCGAQVACKRREQSELDARLRRLLARLNEQAARIVPRALAASSLHLSLQYSPELGLVPIISFNPLLLNVEFPPAVASSGAAFAN